MHTPRVSIVKCPDYDSARVDQALRKAIDFLGGIGSFVKPGDKVLVKPNLLMAALPEAGITTHPQVIRAVIRLLKEANARIFVGDEPSTWNHHLENVDYVYEKSGILAVCRQEGVDLVKFEKKNWKGKFPLYAWAAEADVIVNVPKFKTHQLTTLTAAVKNLYGFVAGTYKAEIHKNYFKPEDFSRAVVDIYELVRPCLTIVDGIVAMQGDGPATAGKLRNMGLVVCGTDCLAVDSVLATIMGLEPDSIYYIKEAVKRGLGTSNTGAMQIFGEPLEAVTVDDFILPTSSVTNKIPVFMVSLLRKLIKLRPRILPHACTRCGSCVKICPKKVITMSKGKVHIDYSGCISCFCCQEACPSAAIKVQKSFLAKVVGL